MLLYGCCRCAHACPAFHSFCCSRRCIFPSPQILFFRQFPGFGPHLRLTQASVSVCRKIFAPMNLCAASMAFHTSLFLQPMRLVHLISLAPMPEGIYIAQHVSVHSVGLPVFASVAEFALSITLLNGDMWWGAR